MSNKLTQVQAETLKKLQAKLAGKSPDKQLNLIYNWCKQGILPKPIYLKLLLMSRGIIDYLESEMGDEAED